MIKILFFFIAISSSLSALATSSGVIYNCSLGSQIQNCVDEAPDHSHIKLEPGLYESEMIFLRSHITLEIPKDTIVQLADNAYLNPDAFGGVSNALIMVSGTELAPITNVHIILDGTLDGNSESHPYNAGGVEGINFVWATDSSIIGSGVVHSANGDGVDIDASKDLYITGITVRNNGGSGIHFGSPRPIAPSKNNLIINVKAYNNGFQRERNGFDVSWPNPDGAIFIGCSSENNYRNWQIETKSVVVNSTSVGGDIKDDVRHGTFVELNGEDKSGFTLLSRKNQKLLSRDIKVFFGLDVPQYLMDLEYE